MISLALLVTLATVRSEKTLNCTLGRTTESALPGLVLSESFESSVWPNMSSHSGSKLAQVETPAVVLRRRIRAVRGVDFSSVLSSPCWNDPLFFGVLVIPSRGYLMGDSIKNEYFYILMSLISLGFKLYHGKYQCV